MRNAEYFVDSKDAIRTTSQEFIFLIKNINCSIFWTLGNSCNIFTEYIPVGDD